VPLVYFLFIKPQASSRTLHASRFTLHYSLYLLIPLAWYINVVPKWTGNGIVRGVLGNNADGSVLIGNFLHHLFITLPELLINYGSVPFFLAAFWFIFKNKAFKKRLFPVFATLGLILIMYFLFELNMIGKSHDYYLFPFLPILFILVSYGAFQLFISEKNLVKEIVVALLIVLPLAAFLRIDQRWNPDKPGFNKDLLVYKNDLRNAVPDNALCVAGNDNTHSVFFYYIDKKGWAFDGDNLDDKQLGLMISQGAEYLYSDSRKLDTNKKIQPYLGEMITEEGSVRVFRLKGQGL